MDTDLEFSFIIVNYKSARQLLACFSSLGNVTISGGYEILVANNDAQETETLLALQQQFAFHLISIDGNRGFGYASNRAAERARGRILVFLNPDARFLSGDFSLVSSAFGHGQSKVGVVGFRLLVEPEMPQQWSAGAMVTFADIVRNHIGMPKSASIWCADAPREVSWVSGAACAVSKECFFAMKGFDEGFFLYYEDVDFCVRVGKSDRKILLFPSIRVLHVGGGSVGTDAFGQKRAYFISQDRYFAKHRSTFEGRLLTFFRRMVR